MQDCTIAKGMKRRRSKPFLSIAVVGNERSAYPPTYGPIRSPQENLQRVDMPSASEVKAGSAPEMRYLSSRIQNLTTGKSGNFNSAIAHGFSGPGAGAGSIPGGVLKFIGTV